MSGTKRKRIVLSDDEEESASLDQVDNGLEEQQTFISPNLSSTTTPTKSRNGNQIQPTMTYNARHQASHDESTYPTTRSSTRIRASYTNHIQKEMSKYTALTADESEATLSDGSESSDQSEQQYEEESDGSESIHISAIKDSRTKSTYSRAAVGAVDASSSKYFFDSHRSTRDRYEEDRYEELYTDDIDDFIQDDDEEDNQSSSDSSGEDDHEQQKSRKRKGKPKSKQVSTKKESRKATSPKRRRILDEDDEENNNSKKVHIEKDDTINVKGIKPKRVIEDDSEPSEGSSNQGDSEQSGEDESDAESGDESTVDDAAFYHRLDAQLDREREDNALTIGDASRALLGTNFTFERREAFWLYFEYLAHVVCSFEDRVDLSEISRVKKQQYDIARKKIEDLICTTRESLIGSGAWQRDYLSELQHRPFSRTSANRCDEMRCAACGKSNKRFPPEYEVTFTGEEYEAKYLYQMNNWERYLPQSKFSSDSNNGKYNDKYENPSYWPVTAHCSSRTLLYHKLLHFKLHLMLRIKACLVRHQWNLADVMEDDEFIEDQYVKYQKLVENTKLSYAHEDVVDGTY